MTFKKIKHAMVLAAGLGTRMRPVTDTIPKPLVPVNGKTLLDHALDALDAAGVEKAGVNVHYLPDQIEEHVKSRRSPKIQISDERDELLDSGGGTKKGVAGFEPEPFFILNADSFWVDGPKPNLTAMADAWDDDAMDLLLLVSSKDRAVGFAGPGDFFMDEAGRLTRRGDAVSAPAIYAGAIIARPDLFEAVGDEKFSLNLLFDEAIAKQRLFGVSLDGLWLHVGTPDAIAEAEQAIAEHKQRAA